MRIHVDSNALAIARPEVEDTHRCLTEEEAWLVLIGHLVAEEGLPLLPNRELPFSPQLVDDVVIHVTPGSEGFVCTYAPSRLL